MLAITIFSASISCYIIYLVFVRHLFSTFRTLPQAEQCNLFLRLFHEPTTFELERWMKETPNNGLIRYYGFMNQERLLLTKPSTLNEVLQREAHKFVKLPWLAAVQRPAGVSGLVTSKGDLHKAHRRHTIAAFNDTSIRRLYPRLWHSVLATSDFLFHTISKDSSVRLNSFFQTASLHTAVQAMFALDFDVIRNGSQPLVQQYQRPFKRGERSPLYMKLLQIVPKPLQHSAVMLVSKFLGINISMMEELVRKTLKSRLEKIHGEGPPSLGFAPSSDILEGLLQKAHQHLSERALLKHAMTTMAASFEMISNQLSWAIYALSHPDNVVVQELLRTEIRTRFPTAPTALTWEDVSSLRYLSGVVNEVLRLYPNVSHRGRVCTTPTTVLDQSIAKGTILTWPVYAINRDSTHWGLDADKFCPERWFLEGKDRTQSPRRNLFAFMTFGQGPHKCPGQHYTHAVMACMLLGLVGRFNFERLTNAPDVIEADAGKRVRFGIVMKASIQANVTEVSGWSPVKSQ